MSLLVPTGNPQEIGRILKSFPTELTIRIDRREQRPWKIPDWLEIRLLPGCPPARILLKSVRASLSEGDYDVQEFPLAGTVERKGSVRELITNLCTSDCGRLEAAARRVEGRSARLLFVEASVYDLVAGAREWGDPSLVISRLSLFSQVYRYELVLGGTYHSESSRKYAAEYVCHWLVAKAFDYATRQSKGESDASEHPRT